MHVKTATSLLDVFERREPSARNYCRWFDRVLTSAQGSVMRDTEGREYLDFLAGAGALNYGHNDPGLKAAPARYVAQDGIAHGLDLCTDVKRDFLETFERLVLAPRGLGYHVRRVKPWANANQVPLQYCTARAGRFPGMPGCTAWCPGGVDARPGAGGYAGMLAGQRAVRHTCRPGPGALGPPSAAS